MQWYDLDLPEVISFKKKFFRQTSRFKFIPKTVFDFSWMKEIEKIKKNHILFIAEGLFIYFKEKEVKEIFIKLAKYFPNAEILFSAMSPIIANTKRNLALKINTNFKWGINSGKELEKWDTRIKFIEEWYYYDYHKNTSWKMRLFKYIPLIRKLRKVVHIKFLE